MSFKDKEQITIFLTSNCNLSCTYCYMPKMKIGKKDQIIDLDFAKAGLEYFFSNFQSRTVRFFSSGEPTIAFREMKNIYDIAYQMVGDDLKIELETNGFFGEEIADWIDNHVDYLWISFDGLKHIHNKQRPTTYNKDSHELVVSNINRFVNNKNMQFGVRATIAEANIRYQKELIDYFHTLKLKNIAASPTYHSKVNSKIKTPSLLDFAKHFVPAFNRAKKLGMFYQTLLIVNFFNGSDIYCQASTPTPRLTSDGYVSSCDWASFGSKYLPSPTQQQLIYGKWDETKKIITFDKEKLGRIRLRNSEYLSKNFCKNCKYIKYCNAGCVGKMVAATDDLYKASKDWCLAIEYLFERLEISSPLPFLHP